jgi:bifunctional DNA-binding transcriptional regulator/antitoxin component of YhaV-PrlF toxin-antitoxin module
MIKTTLTIDEDGILTFPEEILDKLGWKEDDMIEWIDRQDGTFQLRKVDETAKKIHKDQ